MDDVVTEEEIKQLPRWAAVAFAARCAARVHPLYRLPNNHENLEIHVKAIDDAIRLAEAYSAKAARVPDAADAAANVAAKAANPATNVASYAADAAYAAAAAAAYASVTAKAAVTTKAAKAAAAAYAAYVVADDIGGDFQQLLEYSKTENWTDETPVDHWQVLGLLWPDGEPEWFTEGCQWHEKILGRALYGPDEFPWNYEGKARTESTIPLEFEIPDGMPDEEVEVYIKELLRKIDDHHRSLGGSGVKVNRLQITGVPTEVGVQL